VLRLFCPLRWQRRAIGMMKQKPAGKRLTLAGDRGYDTQALVEDLRDLTVTPHVAQHTTNRRSAIDGRTTRHEGYAVISRGRLQQPPLGTCGEMTHGSPRNALALDRKALSATGVA
jgi:hypothetical protein